MTNSDYQAVRRFVLRARRIAAVGQRHRGCNTTIRPRFQPGPGRRLDSALVSFDARQRPRTTEASSAYHVPV